MSEVQNKIKSSRHKSSTKYHICPSQGIILNWKPAQGRAFWRSDPAQTGLPSKWICISTRYYAFTYCLHYDPHKDIRYNIMINDKMLTNVILQALPGTWVLVLRVQVLCKCCAVSESMTPILLAINFPEAFVKMIKRQKGTIFALQRQMLIYSARFPFRYLMDGTAIGKGKSIVLQYRRWLLEYHKDWLLIIEWIFNWG